MSTQQQVKSRQELQRAKMMKAELEKKGQELTAEKIKLDQQTVLSTEKYKEAVKEWVKRIVKKAHDDARSEFVRMQSQTPMFQLRTETNVPLPELSLVWGFYKGNMVFDKFHTGFIDQGTNVPKVTDAIYKDLFDETSTKNYQIKDIFKTGLDRIDNYIDEFKKKVQKQALKKQQTQQQQVRKKGAEEVANIVKQALKKTAKYAAAEQQSKSQPSEKTYWEQIKNFSNTLLKAVTAGAQTLLPPQQTTPVLSGVEQTSVYTTYPTLKPVQTAVKQQEKKQALPIAQTASQPVISPRKTQIPPQSITTISKDTITLSTDAKDWNQKNLQKGWFILYPKSVKLNESTDSLVGVPQQIELNNSLFAYVQQITGTSLSIVSFPRKYNSKKVEFINAGFIDNYFRGKTKFGSVKADRLWKSCLNGDWLTMSNVVVDAPPTSFSCFK